jgi:hypothetical protein
MQIDRFLVMETARHTAARIARTTVTPHAGVDTALFLTFLGLAIIGSAIPWALATAIPLGLAWATRGIVEDSRKRAADKIRVRDYEERIRSTYERSYLNA